MNLTHVVSVDAPPAQGAYSHAVRAGDLLHCSTQLPLDPRSVELCDSSPYEQARQCLENLDAVCRAGGAALVDAARITVYFADRAVMPAVDRAFGERFDDQPPARVPVHVVSLARGAAVSMDAIVAIRGPAAA